MVSSPDLLGVGICAIRSGLPVNIGDWLIDLIESWMPNSLIYVQRGGVVNRPIIFALLLFNLTVFAKGPELTFDNKNVQLGMVSPDSKYEVVFPFTNTGDEILNIEAVKPG